MSQKIIIGFIVVAAVAAGGYFLMNQGASQDEMQNESEASENAFMGSWNDIVARGGTWQCDISKEGMNDSTEGTVYVSGANVRGDFSSVTSAGTIESHMLKLGEDLYVWSNAYPQGFTMKATAEAQGGTATEGQGIDQGESYAWDCDPTASDASRFEKPANVEFMDLNAMLESGMRSY